MAVRRPGRRERLPEVVGEDVEAGNDQTIALIHGSIVQSCVQAWVQSQLGMDLAADSLSTWRAANRRFGAERLEPGGRNADEDENDRRDCIVLPELPADSSASSWSVLTLVSG